MDFNYKSETIFYKEKEHIRKILKNNHHPNIILYGMTGIGKTQLIHNVIKEKFGELNKVNNDKIIMESNNSCYYFNISLIIDKDYFIKYIKDIIKSYDYYTDKLKYIIIDNYELISNNIQRFLKVFIEKSYQTTRFIIVTNKIDAIDYAIKSRCYLFRVSEASRIEKYIYVKDYLNSNGFKFNKFLLKKDCDKYSINHVINKHIYHDNHDYIDYTDLIVDGIIQIIYSSFNLDNIRKISSNIKELNINQYQLFKKFYNKIVKIIGPSNIIKCNLLIKEIAISNHIIQDSYRELIHIESLIIKLYSVINYDN